MRYGFAIDQRTCIGCHACTVACKVEHEIPLGQFRTWVKYVDKGEYPSTTREFGVMRCNHCTDAPCVKICPTKALFKRDDGIVDFDSERCIGCKSCMQACPYDAIYIDADTHTAAKCNMCAHRIDEGREPACVTACPTHSIWVGDLDDPDSGIGRLVRENQTNVRAPEQNTGPNVFYLGADLAVLDPLEAPVADTYIWAKPDAQRLATQHDIEKNPVTQAVTTLNTAHPRPRGWRVTAYLWTKSVAAGAMLVSALGLILGVEMGSLTNVVSPIIALFMLAVTGVLLIWDLKRPERFVYIFLKSHWTSWLVIGSWCIAVFGGLATLWLGAGWFDIGWLLDWLKWLIVPAAGMVAGYTAFLFGQAEGRDLWQSPVLFWHLIAQAFMVGAGILAVVAQFHDFGAGTGEFLGKVLIGGTIAHLVILLVEFGGRHSSRNAATAAHAVTHGRYAGMFWSGALACVAAAVFASFSANGMGALLALAGALVQIGLLCYESTFVRAAQDVPLS
ncbi:4Fe-4S dicluster domain-containing protein [Nocardia seriolae]|uniref:Formate dehydrogenase iron-sulfur subunit n=1 Tax=Nocardia seriolae TaxID=37332 RepID=A0ABC9Z5Q0_9NOCA|nr:4Fe-4S dicluster domain-containing protein [Nocardia seriolae]APA98513.1 Formate dehydrogenase iron-sulfur subunit [Nocardia seriolae]MTJ63609.1 4Fe-4S dicluster domain-containing protein [Nocardia seriolae]MTJ74800.1 4Fe-4S dicluster domain-containing protein [Nocardia seriolae]MTJ88180.1 4Fe-4S dicluster domain-containing protein [Nocardia seriolae]MTK32168.1 4Fe-4S dicluster domain-containing protein [Nocardia seriolae]